MGGCRPRSVRHKHILGADPPHCLHVFTPDILDRLLTEAAVVPPFAAPTVRRGSPSQTPLWSVGGDRPPHREPESSYTLITFTVDVLSSTAVRLLVSPLCLLIMREDQVSKAVEFLRHPTVKSREDAVAFLRQKGLEEAEIDEALRRSGATGQASPSPPVPKTAAGASAGPGALGWLWRVALGLGALSVLRKLLKKYVVPLYFPQAAASSRLAETAATATHSSTAAVRKELRQLREAVEETRAALRTLNEQLQRWSDTARLREELRSELLTAIASRDAARGTPGAEARSASAAPGGNSATAAHSPSAPPPPPTDSSAAAADADHTLPDFGDIEPAQPHAWSGARSAASTQPPALRPGR